MSPRAVLTGDLVRSSDLTDASLNEARFTLLQAAGEIATWQKDLIGAEPDFFRGDSWQILLTSPQLCLRSAAFLRAKLRAANPNWDTRIAIGVGEVVRVDRARTSLSTGEAFTLSGHALDGIGGATMTVAMPPEIGASASGMVPLAQICGVMIDDWSPKQAQIACLALPPNAPTQAEIAERLGITQQSVSKTIAAAKLPSLLQAIAYCEQLKWVRRPKFI